MNLYIVFFRYMRFISVLLVIRKCLEECLFGFLKQRKTGHRVKIT